MANGFGLVEVLISLFILACGLVGIMQIQHSALQRTQDAYYLSLAVNQISNIQQEFALNAVDCKLWQIENQKFFPHTKVKCNATQASICWLARNGKERCITSSLGASYGL